MKNMSLDWNQFEKKVRWKLQHLGRQLQARSINGGTTQKQNPLKFAKWIWRLLQDYQRCYYRLQTHCSYKESKRNQITKNEY